MLQFQTRLVAALILLSAEYWWLAPESSADGSVADGGSAPMRLDRASAANELAIHSLDLDQAIQLAKAHNPRLLAVLANIEVSEGERVEAGLWENPELVVYSEEIPVDAGGFSAAKNMIGIAQTVPFPGKKSLEREAADLGIAQFRNEYNATKLEIVRDVRIAFYRVLAAQRSVEIFEELSTLSQSLAETAEKRLNAGEAPAQELLRAEIEWQRARTDADHTRGKLAEAKRALVTLLGRPDLQKVPLSGALAFNNSSVLSPHAHHDALLRHPQLKKADLAIQEAEAVYRRSKREPLPDLTFEVAFGNRDSELEGSENLAEVAVSLPLPLIDRGQGAKHTSRGKLTAARAHREAIEQVLLEQYGSAATRLRTATTRVKNYQDGILPKTEEALALMQRGFQEGKFSFIDLLDTQRTVAETRLDYQEALYELNAAEATLDSLLAHENINEKEK